MATTSRQQTARQLVLYHRRSGGPGQSQFLLTARVEGAGRPLRSALLGLGAPNQSRRAGWTVEDLAEQAGMSSRHSFPTRALHPPRPATTAVEGRGAAET